MQCRRNTLKKRKKKEGEKTSLTFFFEHKEGGKIGIGCNSDLLQGFYKEKRGDDEGEKEEEGGFLWAHISQSLRGGGGGK